MASLKIETKVSTESFGTVFRKRSILSLTQLESGVHDAVAKFLYWPKKLPY